MTVRRHPLLILVLPIGVALLAGGAPAGYATVTVAVQPGMDGYAGFDHEQLNRGGWGNAAGYTQHGYVGGHEVFALNGPVVGSLFRVYSLVRFAGLELVVPVGSTVASALLEMRVRTVEPAGASDRVLVIRHALQGWTDSTDGISGGGGVYYQNWGNGGETAGFVGPIVHQGLQDFSSVRAGDVVRFPLDPSIVQGWIDFPPTNHGVRLELWSGSEGVHYNFDGQLEPGTSPTLLIEIAPAGN